MIAHQTLEVRLEALEDMLTKHLGAMAWELIVMQMQLREMQAKMKKGEAPFKNVYDE
jgi:hypothetical protein